MQIPKIRLEKTDLLIDGYRIALDKRYRLVQTIEVFLRSPRLALTRKELLTALAPAKIGPTSPRLYESEVHNIVKSISRVRVLLLASLPVSYSHIEWFPYCNRKELWTFYRLREINYYQWNFPQKLHTRRGVYAAVS